MYCNYIFVRGFDTALSRDVIRAALWKRFESLGCDVRRVFVPIECRTGVPLGFVACSLSPLFFAQVKK